jgi:limonene-1,2-epoxide hydrolase
MFDETVRIRSTAIAVAALIAATAVGVASAAAPKTPAQVVRAWSRALNASNDRAAGALFARNAVTVQGPVVIRLPNLRMAILWNAGLPCSGRITRLRVNGNVASATFVLGERKGHRCDGPGVVVAAKFTVVKGKIVRWEQVAPEEVTGPKA